jgi:hypothetical protein
LALFWIFREFLVAGNVGKSFHISGCVVT